MSEMYNLHWKICKKNVSTQIKKVQGNLRGTQLKTRNYQTVILTYLRYVSTRIIAPWCMWTINDEIYCFYAYSFTASYLIRHSENREHKFLQKQICAMPNSLRVNSSEDYLPDSFEIFSKCSCYAYLFVKTRKLTNIFFTTNTLRNRKWTPMFA